MQITKDFIEQTIGQYKTLKVRAQEVLEIIDSYHSVHGFNYLDFQSIDDTKVYFFEEGECSYTFPTACLYDDSAIEAHVQKIKDSIVRANQAKIEAEAARQARIKEDQYAEYLRLKNLFGE